MNSNKANNDMISSFLTFPMMLSSHHQGNDNLNKFGSTTDVTSVNQVDYRISYLFTF